MKLVVRLLTEGLAQEKLSVEWVSNGLLASHETSGLENRSLSWSTQLAEVIFVLPWIQNAPF
jgi:hypothetical protein